MDYDLQKSDVVVIGGGIAGLTAAYCTDMKKGQTLTLLAMGTGASPHVSGFNIPLHENDSVESFIEDTYISGQNLNDPDLVERLCRDSLDQVSFLESIGFEFDRDGEGFVLRRPLGSTYPRVAGKGNVTGSILLSIMREELSKREGVTLYGALRALRLLVKDGSVKGVVAYDTENKKLICIETKAVVLATGGFCNIFPFSTNESDIGGDGIAMAYDAGATLTDMEFIQFEPCTAVAPQKIYGKAIMTTMFFENAVLRNNKGHRFMLDHGEDAERVNKDILSFWIRKEIENGNGGSNGGVWFDATDMDEERLRRAYDIFYKRYINCGIDLSKEQVEVAPAAHTSLGGVMISKDCSTQVKGLFACGEVIGGLHGANRIGGNAGLETIVFGRAAAESVKAYISGQHESSTEDNFKAFSELIENSANSSGDSKEDINEIALQMRTSMEKILIENLNVIRKEKGLQFAVDELGKLLNEVEGFTADTPEKYYVKMRLYNDIITARIATLSALERKESVGCHIRDEEKGETEGKYNIQVSRNEGEIVPQKVPRNF